MAKIERTFKGKYESVLEFIDKTLKDQLSCQFEAETDFVVGDVKSAIRVYERYSLSGSNRLSISITLLSHGEDIYLSAITSGGSQAIFFKMNRIGEDRLLNQFDALIFDYIRNSENHNA